MRRREFLEHGGRLTLITALCSPSAFLSSLSLFSSPSSFSANPSYPQDFDLLIKNATIINGLAEPAFEGDIGIRDEKIMFVGFRGNKQVRRGSEAGIGTNLQASSRPRANQVQPAEGLKVRRIIEANGKVVCPGFIDIHSHTGAELLVNPQAESKIRQGVTTELSGNCGSADWPLKEALTKEERRYFEELGISELWTDLASFRRILEGKRISLNYATLIGHGTVRAYVMGEARRKPSPAELAEMKKIVAQGMEQGAFGLSTGLEYTPSGFAEREELVELCRIVADYGGFYATHIRSEDNEVIEAISEAISIATEARLPLEVSHLKACGQRNWWKMPFLFDLIEKAREKGIEVTADAYPYTAYSTGLTVFFPFWAFAAGEEDFLKKLASPEEREKMRPETEAKLGGMPWESVLIVDLRTEKNQKLIGKNIAEAAKERGLDPFTFSCQLLEEERGHVSIVGFGMSEENTAAVLRHPLVMIASDGSALAPYGPLHRGRPHPRNYGTFPRFLGYYVRDQKILTLTEAVRKITSLPARKLGLQHRGVIREGYFADLVIFAPERIADRATYTDPEKYPEGIDYVIVNGQVVIDHGQHTGAFPGKFLNGPGWRPSR
ncbi:MAG: N-acyl-D-amino-acid deacylase family protein [Candidatus Aminicenantales bacterium]